MTREPAPKPLELLLVEDNPGDVHLFMHALKRADTSHNVSTVTDGAAALAYLRREGKHEAAPRPDLIILDLNLPKRGGREVLAAIKADPELQEIPVIVLTSSEAERDIRESYALKANCYVTKPVELHDFLSTIRSIEEF
ncbi:MAG TPA: response regulator, partial [Polyangiales bacterium]|nr:response regulator [Polyangiales bacterium]